MDRSPEVLPIQDYLERFGYLAPAAYRRGELDETTVRGLTLLQRRLGLTAHETRAAMAAQRCGLPDAQHGTDALVSCPWPTDTLTYRFLLDEVTMGGLSVEQAGDAVRAAFATWSTVVPLVIHEARPHDAADVVVEWRPAADPDHSMVGGIVAHADWPGACAVVTHDPPKPLHFDATEHSWVVGAVPGALDIETIALHEIGHLLGLRHSTDRSAVMYPIVRFDATARTLQPDDLAAAQSIYPYQRPNQPITSAIRASQKPHSCAPGERWTVSG